MHGKIWMILALASMGCGQVAAEPIQTSEGYLPITDDETVDLDSDDTYACDIVEADPLGRPDAEIQGLFFLGLPGVADYGGSCKQAGNGARTQCEYTPGPPDCVVGTNYRGDPRQPCGGLVGMQDDAATRTFTFKGVAYMACYYPCESDDECPRASSGTARATCVRHESFFPDTAAARCQLGCENGEACPDGFVCTTGQSVGFADGTSWQPPAHCAQPKVVVFQAQVD